jgi:hypothetical protein
VYNSLGVIAINMENRRFDPFLPHPTDRVRNAKTADWW